MEIATIVMVLGFMMPLPASAAEGPSIHDLCKAECPKAQNEEEAHKCMEQVIQKKKSDRKFRKTDCYAAVKEHEKHEKEEGHKH
jgi:hypothetical protein